MFREIIPGYPAISRQRKSLEDFERQGIDRLQGWGGEKKKRVGRPKIQFSRFDIVPCAPIQPMIYSQDMQQAPP
ncbi:hypothetical protein TWF192_002781 [Orbilia oligospora]|nr:hypothetical protein TWF192_002781 [Orbilia oligospora]